MFSGIVESVGNIVQKRNGTLVVATTLDSKDVRIGHSIAVNGCCLTVTAIENGSNKQDNKLFFDVSPETFRVTNLQYLKEQSLVNLEKSLQVGERIHGHIVTGHVDTVVKLLAREVSGNATIFRFAMPDQLSCFIAQKGSIAVNGISLTIVDCTETLFSVYAIPHTFEVTNLKAAVTGDIVNLEVDPIARYVVNALQKTENFNLQKKPQNRKINPFFIHY
jgi:riboflavin synthase